MAKNFIMSIDFIAFKKAMKSNKKAAGKVVAFYGDYMADRISIETFYEALCELDRKSEVKFIVRNTNMDEVVCDFQYGMTQAARATF